MEIIANEITKVYKTALTSLSVLSGITMRFQAGVSYGITGPSGSGKSTLLHILGMLDKPTSGQLCYDNDAVHALCAAKRAYLLRDKVGFVFQFHYLINELTLFENIAMPGAIAKKSQQYIQSRVFELLQAVGLSDKADRLPSQLSGGEQQRVAFARALFNKPAFLLADEPTGNLDAHNAQQIVALLKRAQAQWGMGVILCSHDPSVYGAMNQVLTMKDGLLQVA